MSDNIDTINVETLKKRAAVPGTRALQESILLETQTMPQRPQVVSLAALPQPWRRRLQIGLPVAACVLVAVLIFGPLSMTIESDKESGLQNAASLDDLEWQEIMLQEDELLLAQF